MSLKCHFWELITIGESLLDSCLKRNERWRRHQVYSCGLGWILAGSSRAAVIMQRLSGEPDELVI